MFLNESYVSLEDLFDKMVIVSIFDYHAILQEVSVVHQVDYSNDIELDNDILLDVAMKYSLENFYLYHLVHIHNHQLYKVE